MGSDIWPASDVSWPGTGVIWPGPSTSFDPSQISGLTLRLHSDKGVTTSGALVTTWANQAPVTGLDATASGAARPTLVANVQNGRPGILSANSSQILKNATTQLIAQNAARHIFIVARTLPNGSTYQDGGPMFQMPIGGPSFCCVVGTVGTEAAGNWTPPIAYTDGFAVNMDADGSPNHQATFVYELSGATGTGAGLLNYTVNGLKQILTSHANKENETNAHGYSVGGRTDAGAGQFFSGYFFDILVYSRVLSLSEATQVRTYLATLNGLSMRAQPSLRLQAQNNKVWNFHGDSITANSYFTEFVNALTAYGHAPASTSNTGVGGDTIAQMTARISTAVVPLNPDYSVVDCAINDAQQGRTTAQVTADATTMLQTYATLLPSCKVIVCGPMCVTELFPDPTWDALLNAYDVALAGVCASFGVPYVSWRAEQQYQESFRNPGGALYNNVICKIDGAMLGIHPNANIGQQIVSNVLYNSVDLV